MNLQSEKLGTILKEILSKETCLKDNGDNTFTGEIYTDYNDELTEDSLKKISKSDNPMDTFYECFCEIDCEDYEYDYLLSTLRSHWDEEKYGAFKENYNEINDWIRENVCFNFPYEHFLNQTVDVNIIVDTGDGNYDFTLNNFVSYNSIKNEIIANESSILWLVKQQGYKKRQLNKAIRHNDFGNSKFLKSINEECLNVTTHMNALAFFVKMTLENFIDLKADPCDIIISKEANCGLYDCWNGAGSILNIELEKPVTIPKEFVEAHIDGARGYGIESIYGMSTQFWKDDCISLYHHGKRKTA